MANDIYTNSEGYNDQTAGKAIAYLSKKSPKKGEIWTISNPDILKDPAEWLVIADVQTNGWVSCLEVKDERTRPINDNTFCVRISSFDPERRYVDTRNVWSKPSRYFLERVQEVEPCMSSVESALIMSLQLGHLLENDTEKLIQENRMLREKIKSEEWSKIDKNPIYIPEEIHAEKVHVELKLINGGTEKKIVIH